MNGIRLIKSKYPSQSFICSKSKIHKPYKSKYKQDFKEDVMSFHCPCHHLNMIIARSEIRQITSFVYELIISCIPYINPVF